jgi:hypothetical protein
MHAPRSSPSSRSRKQTRRSTDATPTVAARATGASAAKTRWWCWGGARGVRRSAVHLTHRHRTRSWGRDTQQLGEFQRARRNLALPAASTFRRRSIEPRSSALASANEPDRGVTRFAPARDREPQLRAGTRGVGDEGFRADRLLPNQVARAVLARDVPQRSCRAHVRAIGAGLPTAMTIARGRTYALEWAVRPCRRISGPSSADVTGVGSAARPERSRLVPLFGRSGYGANTASPITRGSRK